MGHTGIRLHLLTVGFHLPNFLTQVGAFIISFYYTNCWYENICYSYTSILSSETEVRIVGHVNTESSINVSFCHKNW